MTITTILCLILSSFPANPTIEAVLRAEKETRQELNNYTFKRDLLWQTIGRDGQVTGEYIRNSEFVFNDSGDRIEKVLYKKSTLKWLRLTDEDIEDFAGTHLLGLEHLDQYDLEVNEGVIDVRPRSGIEGRYFVGSLQYDPRTLKIVKVRGRAEPAVKDYRFPFFETTRDEKGFPILTTADDVLRFPTKDIRVKVVTKYYDYRRFRGSEPVIKEVDEPMTFDSMVSKGAPIIYFPTWKRDSVIEVYTQPGAFTLEQQAAIQRALNAWNIEIVTFKYMGEGQGTITIYRDNVLAHDGKHFAYFKSFTDGLTLLSGQMVVDHKVVRVEALESVVAHEIGHGMSLSDCRDCKSVMRNFSSVGKANGYYGPTPVDLVLLGVTR